MQEITLLGVVGKNIAYSQSPFIHHTFAQAENIALRYTIEDVGDEGFAATIARLRQAGFTGCNVTVPYKEEAFLLADQTSARAQRAGAANTLIFKESYCFADNTDGYGFVQDLAQNLKYSTRGKRILICGAGGAVRGILEPLLDTTPLAITIANRDLAKAETLAHTFSTPDLRLNASPYAALADASFDLVIDATSLRTEALPLPETLRVAPQGLVYDLKYAVPHNCMIAWAQRQGASATEGLGMLVEQAAEAFYLWTSKRPATHTLLTLLRNTYEN